MVESAALLALSALTHPLRLRTIRYLVQAAPDGLTAGDISKRIEASPSKTSFHLNLLSEAGLVSTERKARNVIYAANFQALGQMMQYLVEDCCGGHPLVRGCCAATPSNAPNLEVTQN